MKKKLLLHLAFMVTIFLYGQVGMITTSNVPPGNSPIFQLCCMGNHLIEAFLAPDPHWFQQAVFLR